MTTKSFIKENVIARACPKQSEVKNAFPHRSSDCFTAFAMTNGTGKKHPGFRLFRSLIACAAAICCTMFLFSCEKEVHLNLNTGEQKLVVDGFIENDQPPLVILTKSIGYLSTIDLSTLENAFVHGAVVKVSDGSRTITLREYAIDTGKTFNKFSFYTIDTADASSFSFVGVIEKQYTLSIDYNGKNYSATTKIPNVRPLDSVWFRNSQKQNVPTATRMYVKFTDPDTLGNNIRYFTRRNSNPFFTGPQSVYDDQIINGLTIDSLAVFAGYDKASVPDIDSIGNFYEGDTVTLRWCAIDRKAYEFYNTFEYATGTVGNPFASPVNVISNIQGGALGVWVGYGAYYVTRVIPKQ